MKHLKERVDFINDNDPYGEENWNEHPPFRRFNKNQESVDEWLKSIGATEEEIFRLTDMFNKYVKIHKEVGGFYGDHNAAQIWLFRTLLPYINTLADRLNLSDEDRNTFLGVLVLNKIK